MNQDVTKFLLKYNTESDFREFINDINKDEILMEFGYLLYLKFGKETIEKTRKYVNQDYINLDKLIGYFESISEFEKCEILNKIKKNDD